MLAYSFEISHSTEVLYPNKQNQNKMSASTQHAHKVFVQDTMHCLPASHGQKTVFFFPPAPLGKEGCYRHPKLPSWVRLQRAQLLGCAYFQIKCLAQTRN